MTGLSNRRYQRQSMLAMVVYVVLLLTVWPLARTADGMVIKFVLALAPVLPMFYLFMLMARHIRDSDELQQRMHLQALGVATMVTAALSLVGGFLAAAQVVALDGSILVWVFPVMIASHGITRAVLARRYGGDGFPCADSGVPLYQRLLLVAVLAGGVAVLARVKGDAQAWGVFLGLAIVLAVFGVALLLRQWRIWRAGGQGKPRS